MASLELRNKTYRVVFMYGGRKLGFSLNTRDKTTAEKLRGGVEMTLMLLTQGRVILPDGVDLIEFIRLGGKPPAPTKPPQEATAFSVLRDRYLATHKNGAMEKNSLATVTIHLKHLADTLGENFLLHRLTIHNLQSHIDRRLQTIHRGQRLSPVTIRKEITTFCAVWNWGLPRGLVHGTFPSKGLVYPKDDEKPPFMTMSEMERCLQNAKSDAERAELRDCLYLTPEELEEFLVNMKERATHEWVYPMVCFVAHTGCRRSEALRVQILDVDFSQGTTVIREKKRSRSRRTTRRVPLTPFLVNVLKEWLNRHPGGLFLFCHQGVVARSKKRSQTTGHQWGEGRAKSLRGRKATVRRREAQPSIGLTKDEAHDHLRRTLDGSKWSLVPGWHCLRHTFISACASKGVDQRLIDEWTGHSTEEQRKRYRHLYPDTQQAAIKSVFGEGGFQSGPPCSSRKSEE